MKLNEKIYAQLANRVYDRKDIRNKMTLPEGVTELEWQDDDKWTGFSAGVYQASKNKHDFLFACTQIHPAGGGNVADTVVFRCVVELHGGIERRGVVVAQLAEKRHILLVVKRSGFAVFLHNHNLQIGGVQLFQCFQTVMAA